MGLDVALGRVPNLSPCSMQDEGWRLYGAMVLGASALCGGGGGTKEDVETRVDVMLSTLYFTQDVVDPRNGSQ